ncbi:MAG: rod-binding protein [Spirochaetaceae bacterium]|nr:rod-binding protein [Spirochaetaceae bacterium]
MENLSSVNNSMMLYNNSRLEQLKASAQSGNRFTPRNTELYDACLEFEALFIKQMLNSMRNTVQRVSISDSTTDATSRDFFEDMLYDNYAKKMARTANLGIARMMYLQLYRSQSI